MAIAIILIIALACIDVWLFIYNLKHDARVTERELELENKERRSNDEHK